MPSATQHVLLGLLDGTPRHGYDLKREYDHRFPGLRPLRFSQIYSTLARLDRDGLVTLLDEHAGQGPDRKQYAITPTGISDLETWLSTPLDPGEPPKGELFLKVALALLSGRDAGNLLESQREAHMTQMRALRARKKTAATEADATMCDYGLFHLEADIKWMEHTRSRLARLTTELST